MGARTVTERATAETEVVEEDAEDEAGGEGEKEVAVGEGTAQAAAGEIVTPNSRPTAMPLMQPMVKKTRATGREINVTPKVTWSPPLAPPPALRPPPRCLRSVGLKRNSKHAPNLPSPCFSSCSLLVLSPSLGRVSLLDDVFFFFSLRMLAAINPVQSHQITQSVDFYSCKVVSCAIC